MFQAVRNTHVNLVDLVDLVGTQETAQTFPTEVALSEYTRSTENYFPKENAYAGNLFCEGSCTRNIPRMKTDVVVVVVVVGAEGVGRKTKDIGISNGFVEISLSFCCLLTS